ncbi:MAG TPA: protein kinase [Gemmataceae bacterium]|jgi:serine/threonine-protein kinase
MADAASSKVNLATHLTGMSSGGAAPVDSPGADLTGRTLGEFEILRKIGAGGMGQVYLARQLSLKRQVALKLLRKDLAGNATAMLRFQAEAEAVATLNHPNIVQVYGAGESDGLRYMALEFVDGRNLREHLARKGPPDLPIAISIIRQVALALQKAHERGLVHRDIKPENILVTRKVEVKVTDFGLSRFFTGEAVHLTQSGVTLGTPLYLSPEQAQGQEVDFRSDLYSLGVTSYHLLSGEPPFKGATALEVALKHLTDVPRPLGELRPDLPADLCALIHRLMAKKPAERPQSARELLRELGKVKEAHGAKAGPASARSANPAATVPLALSSSGNSPSPGLSSHSGTALLLVPRPRRWLRWAFAGVACLVALSVGAIAAAIVHPRKPPAKPEPQPLAGLPDIRLPEKKLVTPRERELLAIVQDRSTPADSWTSAAIELGLLYLREGRLNEATARFEAMEKETFPAAPAATLSTRFAGRLGKAIVMAHRDNDPQHPKAAQESLQLFNEALTTPPPILLPKGKGDRPDAIRRFLIRHADLAQAAAEALNRNEVNGAKIAGQLNLLRSPRSLSKKD